MVNESVEMLHLRRRLLDFGRYVSPHLGEASGNPMTFNTDIARNLHKLVIPFSPVQDLHGYDHPWPGGGEKNKINAPDITLAEAGDIFNGAVSLAAGTYTLSSSNTTVSVSVAGETGVMPITFTLAEEVSSLQITASDAGTFSNIQLEEGSSATAYVPYENICPIEGWTGATIEKRGLNLLIPDDPENPSANYTFNSTGRVHYEAEYDAYRQYAPGVAYSKHAGKNQKLFIAPFPMTVTFSVDVCEFEHNYGLRLYRSANGGSSSRITDIHGTFEQWSHYEYTTTLQKDGFLSLICYGGIYWKNLQVVYQASADEYIPYQAETLPISWQDEAGTVYGGSLTINEDGSADLVDMYMCRSIGSMSSITAPPSTAAEPWSHRWLARHWRSGPNATWEAGSSWIMTTELAAGDARRNGTYETSIGYLYDNTITTVAEFREKYKDVFACYKLKNQFYNTYHFDNIGQLKTFIGQNIIWSDTNGINSAEYWTHLN